MIGLTQQLAAELIQTKPTTTQKTRKDQGMKKHSRAKPLPGKVTSWVRCISCDALLSTDVYPNTFGGGVEYELRITKEPCDECKRREWVRVFVMKHYVPDNHLYLIARANELWAEINTPPDKVKT